MVLSYHSKHCMSTVLILFAFSIFSLVWTYTTGKYMAFWSKREYDYNVSMVFFGLVAFSSILTVIGTAMRRMYLALPLWLVGCTYLGYMVYEQISSFDGDYSDTITQLFVHGGLTFVILNPTVGVWRETKREEQVKKECN